MGTGENRQKNYWNKAFANTLKVSSSSLEKVDSVSQESCHHNWTATISPGETLILQKKKNQAWVTSKSLENLGS